MNHYQVLGVNRRADITHIRRAFIVHSRRSHPDLGPAEERESRTRQMRKVNAAYQVLRDPTTRAAYDLSLDVTSAGQLRSDAVTHEEPMSHAPTDQTAAQTTVDNIDWQQLLTQLAREAIATPVRRWLSLGLISLTAGLAGGIGLAISIATIMAIVMAVMRSGEITPAHDVARGAKYLSHQLQINSEAGMLWLAVRNRSWPWLAAVLGGLAAAIMLYLVVGSFLPGWSRDIAALVGFAVGSLILLPAAGRASRALL